MLLDLSFGTEPVVSFCYQLLTLMPAFQSVAQEVGKHVRAIATSPFVASNVSLTK